MERKKQDINVQYDKYLHRNQSRNSVGYNTENWHLPKIPPVPPWITLPSISPEVNIPLLCGTHSPGFQNSFSTHEWISVTVVSYASVVDSVVVSFLPRGCVYKMYANACDPHSLTATLVKRSTVWTDHCFFICFTINGHLGCLWFGAIMNIQRWAFPKSWMPVTQWVYYAFIALPSCVPKWQDLHSGRQGVAAPQGLCTLFNT